MKGILDHCKYIINFIQNKHVLWTKWNAFNFEYPNHDIIINSLFHTSTLWKPTKTYSHWIPYSGDMEWIISNIKNGIPKTVYPTSILVNHWLCFVASVYISANAKCQHEMMGFDYFNHFTILISYNMRMCVRIWESFLKENEVDVSFVNVTLLIIENVHPSLQSWKVLKIGKS